MMDEKLRERIQRHIATLYNYRLQDALIYWDKLSVEKRNFMLGTSMLIDGQYDQANRFYQQLPLSFPVLYNQKTLHQEISSDKAAFYERTLSLRYPDEYRLKENEVINNKVAYFLSNVSVTGGTRMMLKQKKMLERNGFQVDLFLSHPFAFEKKQFHSEFFNDSYEAFTYVWDEEIPQIAKHYDIAIAPYFDFFYPLYFHFKKIFYYCQGDYTTYSEIPELVHKLRVLHGFPVHIYTVSNFLHDVIYTKFSRKSFIHPCDIDLTLFRQGPKFMNNTILMVGNGSKDYGLKGVRPTIKALLEIDDPQFEIIWITPNSEDSYEDSRVKVVNNPDQDILASYYRQATLYVSGSGIEAFPLPPIEAMASGTAVIAADSGGINHYGIHEQNVLLYEFGDYERMKDYVRLLLSNSYMRETLILNGIKTAQRYVSEELDHKFLDYFQKSLKRKYIVHN